MLFASQSLARCLFRQWFASVPCDRILNLPFERSILFVVGFVSADSIMPSDSNPSNSLIAQ
jgi:hypothetical protein